MTARKAPGQAQYEAHVERQLMQPKRVTYKPWNRLTEAQQAEWLAPPKKADPPAAEKPKTERVGAKKKAKKKATKKAKEA